MATYYLKCVYKQSKVSFNSTGPTVFERVILSCGKYLLIKDKLGNYCSSGYEIDSSASGEVELKIDFEKHKSFNPTDAQRMILELEVSDNLSSLISPKNCEIVDWKFF